MTDRTERTGRQRSDSIGRTVFGRPFEKRFTLQYWSVVCPVCPVCNVRALWPNGWTDQDETWHAGRPPPWPHCVRWGPSSPSPKGAQLPQTSAHICCGQMAAWIKMSLGMELGLGRGEFVLNGDPAPPAHVYCSQTAGWMKTPLGTEVDLGPGHIVLDGVPALRDAGTAAPHLLGPCLLWPRSPISATAELLFTSDF